MNGFRGAHFPKDGAPQRYDFNRSDDLLPPGKQGHSKDFNIYALGIFWASTPHIDLSKD